ncbi:MAG: sigma-70 family RNA polymerase sigma factor [Thermomicrobiales bacterium]|nr:sigma-70 family RNA polymerase sigma factor [Thermomicrobiales bacterium]
MHAPKPANDWPMTESSLRLVDDDLEVERARTDPAAFATLYERYVTPVWRMCLRASGDATQADDLTATVFLKAFERLNRYQPQGPGSFRSWLYAIALNVVRDEWRKTKRLTPLPDFDVAVDDGPGPEEIALHRITLAEVRDVLTTLNDRHRSIVELRLSGLSTPEIAETLDMSISAVKSAQKRAYATIRECVKGDQL